MEWSIQDFQDSNDKKNDTKFNSFTVDNETYHPKLIRKSRINITENQITTSLRITNNQRPNDCLRKYKFRYQISDQWTKWKEDGVPCEKIEEEINVKFGFIVGISIIWPVIVYLIGKNTVGD